MARKDLRGIVFFTDSRAHEYVTVFDTTLRDGEQTPGIAFTFEQKIEIARQLSAIGVHTIEAGFPASSGGRKRDGVKAIKKLGLDANICGLARSMSLPSTAPWRTCRARTSAWRKRTNSTPATATRRQAMANSPRGRRNQSHFDPSASHMRPTEYRLKRQRQGRAYRDDDNVSL